MADAFERLQRAVYSDAFRPAMLPTVAREALRIAQDPNADVRQLATLIERDPTIATRFIAESNSSLYSFGAKVTGVTTALARLGLGRACELLFRIASEPYLFTSPRFAEEMAILRNHSQAVAAAAGYLAKLRGVQDRDMGIAGLVHDIGAAALLTYIADHLLDFPELDRDRWQLKKVIQSLHVQAGEIVAKKWKVPDMFVTAITHDKPGARDPLALTLTAAHDAVERCRLGGFDPKPAITVEVYLGDKAKASLAITRIISLLGDLLPMGERRQI